MNIAARIGMRFIKIFYAPKDVFVDIKERRVKYLEWLIPFLFVALISVTTIVILLPSVIIPHEIEQIETSEYVTEDVKNARVSFLNHIFHKVATAMEGIFNTAIKYGVLSLFIVWLYTKFGGERVKYVDIFTGVINTGIVASIGNILSTYVKYSQSTLDTGFNFALLFPGISGYLRHLLQCITPFGIWQTALLSIMMMVYLGYNKKKAFAIMFGSYLTWEIILAFIYFSK